MAGLLADKLGGDAHVPPAEDVQHVLALGAALAGRHRHRRATAERVSA
jgi:hypothetical protein